MIACESCRHGTPRGGRLNTWDSQNRLVKCVSGSNTSLFAYGSDGLRRTSVVNGTPTHYALDNGMLVREFSATLQPTATYLPGPRGVEYRRNDATGQTMWYLYDGLGSVLAEIDALGNMTTPRKYDVYGLVRAGDNGTNRHKFVGSLGHTSEDETGLIYMRARLMDPSLGRFISEEPARDGANWFEYCRGNPVNAVDPDGRTAAFWLTWLESAYLLWSFGLANSRTFRRVSEGIAAGFLAYARISGDPNELQTAIVMWNSAEISRKASSAADLRSLSQEVLGMGSGYSAALMVWFYLLFHDVDGLPTLLRLSVRGGV